MTSRTNSTRAYRARHVAMLTRQKARWLMVLTGTTSMLAVLAGCDGADRQAQPQVRIEPPTEQVAVYKSLEECKAAQSDDSVCDTALNEARQLQSQQPGYSAKEQCEAEYGAGNCESRSNSSGGSWFVPAMAGFMLSNALNNRAYPVYVDRNGYVTSYSGRGGGPRSLGYQVPGGIAGRNSLPANMNVQSDPSGRGYVAPGTYNSRPAYTAQSRGGFGQTASTRGGCCG